MQTDTGDGFRIEHDTMGEVRVPAKALWRAQTQRAVENFPISGRGLERTQIRALGLLKGACAQVNKDLGKLPAEKADAIIAAAGLMDDVVATRRILIVLTDGDCDYGSDAVATACRVAATMGVEAVGIGMQAAGVTRAFPPRYSVNVQDLDQLAQVGLGVLVDMLEDAAPMGTAD